MAHVDLPKKVKACTHVIHFITDEQYGRGACHHTNSIIKSIYRHSLNPLTCNFNTQYIIIISIQ
jgi:hypothetical protein